MGERKPPLTCWGGFGARVQIQKCASQGVNDSVQACGEAPTVPRLSTQEVGTGRFRQPWAPQGLCCPAAQILYDRPHFLVIWKQVTSAQV